MKELYKEFGGAVFKSAIVVDVVCPADKKDVTQVMNLLNRQGITSGNSIKGWPRGKRAKQEVPYYAPFARILNTIVETFESFDSENRYYRGIRFYPYAKVMLNGTTNSFKPDIVSLFSKKESISHNVSGTKLFLPLR
ncbi:hypothetical protein SERLADRAFT_458874 [Serpula lacrymans var. lacrymans S7.9]|uniref:Uncharacterized protein n=1 Tax=Serpula lacrymans var. lacrymans (strain S7.9) TaxID=578457 RepID=F8NKP4_SERL9|nr:uncharacterized protein SERLADRAFT_458874 [Serpula lacrymans var. lacrymans S7.9]EGO28456.1 hypothetical protein SERLADRAFT_458874 [Serpula lacrymans var. lacrymans S7.9]